MRAAAALLVLAGACKPSPGPASNAPAGDTTGTPREPTAQTAPGAPHVDVTAAPVEGGAPLAAASAPADALPPLISEHALVPLEVAGFRAAMVALPVGATERRPVVLALHGNFDRPEWQCDVWRGITGGRAFVLCPRGTARPDAPPPLDRWTYGGATAVRSEIDAGLAALRARFGTYIAEGDVLYTGFSLGAILGVGIVSREGGRFPRAVLVEGGHSGWTRERAQAYAASGGKRVLFACGQAGCRNDAAAPSKLLQRLGVEARVVDGGKVGHAYDGPVARAVQEALPWLLADDPRWAALF